MTRRKSLKGNRQAQRNYMAKELQKKQYQNQIVPNKKKGIKNVELPEDGDCQYFPHCRYPDCDCSN